MEIEQYAYFALKSAVVPAAEMAERLGMEPDEVSVRGSRIAEPPRPIRHAWKIVCRKPGLAVDEQIGQIMDRLRPCRERIVAFSAELRARDPDQAGAVLEVVRYFDHSGGEALERPRDPADRHRLLGWALDHEVLEFLVATGAHLDVDEYGSP
ncbi:hypothetical protein GCM10027176_01560 [Actinoallomurus bryophytorum]|uniref:Uncharacterized protein DUF4279 n=1 Tax=Actinoallomurus bryophytorum TaxID=1490222 RepID=A0A543CEH9_9ACTN|nr:DUF4279 domain-containing protein [Actinoallomurus bryophytorum]TQL95420.1 uncharacterized protein DUF4279 [Actinoallomurus bryophytorum]